MIFNVEEMVLMQQLDHSSRGAAIKGLTGDVKLISDANLLRQYLQLIRKLNAMTDEEYATVDFSVYQEDDNEE